MEAFSVVCNEKIPHYREEKKNFRTSYYSNDFWVEALRLCMKDLDCESVGECMAKLITLYFENKRV